MKTSDLTSLAVLALLGAAGFIAWRAYQDAQGVGRTVGSTIVKTADGVVQGTVEAIGGVLGIPLTDAAACRQAIDEGDTWTASFTCTAKEFSRAWPTILDNKRLPDLTKTPDGGQYDILGNRIY